MSISTWLSYVTALGGLPNIDFSAGDVIDTTSSKNVPEGTTYAWSNKTLDTSKVGTQEVTIIVS